MMDVVSGEGTPGPRPIVGVGLKMHLGYAETVAYLTALSAVASSLADAEVFVLPSFPMLVAAQQLLADVDIAYGAQDGHWEDVGPHTGSVGAGTLVELGCDFVEVGHAERRRDFGEDDVMIGRKAAAALRWGLTPIVCVGEESNASDASDVVLRQLDGIFSEIPDGGQRCIVAYEPVWAIGAAKPAALSHTAGVIAAIRTELEERGAKAPVIYGGGVKSGETRSLLDAGADGVFASRAALSLASLAAIVDEVTRTDSEVTAQ